MASKWLKTKACTIGQNKEHATHASKALKRHASQSNKHGNVTEMAYRMVPIHQNNAKMACYTCTYSRPTSPKYKGAI